MKRSFYAAGLAGALAGGLLIIAAVQAQQTQPSGPPPSPPPADSCTPPDGDKPRCQCFCNGYDDKKAGMGEEDPANESFTSCDLAGFKREYNDGFVAAREGEARLCHYKK